MHLTCWVPVLSEVYWACEWSEEAVPMLYRHEGVAYGGGIVGQQPYRKQGTYRLRFIGKLRLMRVTLE